METSGGSRASLAGRYSIALFQLARDEKQIESVSRSLEALRQALAESPDLAAVTTSPRIGRSDAAKAMQATAGSLGLDPLTTRFVGVLARNGRLGQLPNVIREFARLAAEHRGETTAEVISAHPLNDEQLDSLKRQLRSRVGREVAVETWVDSAILGGLVVRLGSQMIDSSIRTKLNTLAKAMRG